MKLIERKQYLDFCVIIGTQMRLLLYLVFVGVVSLHSFNCIKKNC